jgi:hypothetical protein
MQYQMNPINAIHYARDYINPDCKQYYHLANYQVTAVLDGDFSNLSEKGKELYNQTLKRVEQNDFKGTFEKYTLSYDHSGQWWNNVTSEFYDKSEYSCLHTYKNVRILGVLQGKNNTENTEKQSEGSNKTLTSTIIFKTSNWCLTESGSLYNFKRSLK